MHSKVKVKLIGGDGEGWMMDTDLRLAKEALAPVVELVDKYSVADVVHTVWPEQLVENPIYRRMNLNLPVVAAFSNDPYALFERVPGLFSRAKEWFCVAQSSHNLKILRNLNIKYTYHVPYIADLVAMKPLKKESDELISLRQQLKLPSDKYIIASFQRDSLGSDVNSFKPQKGADVLLAILMGLAKRVGTEKFHVLLAGPRRHWLIKKLQEKNIPFTYDGKIVDFDDYNVNILPTERIGQLTNLFDLRINSSRWDAGPRGLLETIACNRKAISSNVGLVTDTLDPECIFENIAEAIAIVEKDMQTGCLDKTILNQSRRLLENQTVESVRSCWEKFYREKIPDFLSEKRALNVRAPLLIDEKAKIVNSKIMHRGFSILNKLKRRVRPIDRIFILSGRVNHVETAFIKGLKEEYLRGKSVESFYQAKSILFYAGNEGTALPLKGQRIFHRISHEVLTSSKEKVLEIYDFNQRHAIATLFDSFYTWEKLKEYNFVNPNVLRPGFRSSLHRPINRAGVFNKTYAIDGSNYKNDMELLARSKIYVCEGNDSDNYILESISFGVPILYSAKGDYRGRDEHLWFSGLKFLNDYEEKLALLEKDYESYEASVYSQEFREIESNFMSLLEKFS